MMRLCVIVIALCALSIATLASPVPRETLFFVAFFSLFFLSYRQAIAVALCAGLIADLFSPLKGTMAASFPAGIVIASLMQKHLLTNRSLPAFLIMGFVSGFGVMLLSLGATSVAAINESGFHDTSVLVLSHGGLFVRGAILDLLFLSLLYYLCDIKKVLVTI